MLKTILKIFTNVEITKQKNSLVMELKAFKRNGLLKNPVRK